MTSTPAVFEEMLHAPETDQVGVRILDAALAEYLDHGFRRTSMDDVARRAGIGRATLYRRFGNRDELVQAVLVRECRRFFTDIADSTESLPTLAEQLVEGFVIGLRNARRHPLLRRMLVTEPEVALPFLTVHGGPALRVVREFLLYQFFDRPDAPATPAGRPEEIAEMLARLSISLVLTADTVLPLETEDQARDTARRYLAPLIPS